MSNILIKERSRREGKGRVIAISRRVYKLSNKSTYYVESESCDGRYYFVRYNPSVFEWCSCFDNSNRSEKCKHIYAIEYAIRFNTVQEVDKLPAEVRGGNKQDTNKDLPLDKSKYESIKASTHFCHEQKIPCTCELSYQSDEYTF